jgi:hypothetical protein
MLESKSEALLAEKPYVTAEYKRMTWGQTKSRG